MDRDYFLDQVNKLKAQVTFHRDGRAFLISAVNEVIKKLSEAAGKQDIPEVWRMIGALESAIKTEVQREEP